VGAAPAYPILTRTLSAPLIVTTKAAYDDLMGARAPLANPTWQAALDAIVRALLDPSSKKVEAGRSAPDRLDQLGPDLPRRTLDPTAHVKRLRPGRRVETSRPASRPGAVASTASYRHLSG
jgi:hypothetical protein